MGKIYFLSAAVTYFLINRQVELVEMKLHQHYLHLATLEPQKNFPVSVTPFSSCPSGSAY
jgi:hypothetical protein